MNIIKIKKSSFILLLCFITITSVISQDPEAPNVKNLEDDPDMLLGTYCLEGFIVNLCKDGLSCINNRCYKIVNIKQSCEKLYHICGQGLKCENDYICRARKNFKISNCANSTSDECSSGRCRTEWHIFHYCE